MYCYCTASVHLWRGSSAKHLYIVSISNNGITQTLRNKSVTVSKTQEILVCHLCRIHKYVPKIQTTTDVRLHADTLQLGLSAY